MVANYLSNKNVLVSAGTGALGRSVTKAPYFSLPSALPLWSHSNPLTLWNTEYHAYGILDMPHSMQEQQMSQG